MRSNNEIKTEKQKRFLAKVKVMLFFILPFDLFLFFWTNYLLNTLANFERIMNDMENAGDYMDDSKSNTPVHAHARSGMGEIPVYPIIEVDVGVRKTEDRLSMIIADPKWDLHKGCEETVERVEQNNEKRQ